jgi:hypothetical protein
MSPGAHGVTAMPAMGRPRYHPSGEGHGPSLCWVCTASGAAGPRQERASRSEYMNHRASRIHHHDLDQRSSLGTGSSPSPGCREPSGLLPTRQCHRRRASRYSQGSSQWRNGISGSSSAAVPLACHSQRCLSVPTGQPRTTPKQHRAAQLQPFAGHDRGRSGFGSRGSEHVVTGRM